ncbi:acyl carrier protein [Microbispora sp. NBRC 16548]|uniref:acyl carrier protein n=1 Tax=Microbispora sp. NBRC 16548 TaxID=3030994 RepID=UPI00161F036B|nr:acyl carrier protein [Microbispora sp. NBRC 16548]GLX06605.1 hypothetical protein Misp03_35320 [Microbispora sp. NBRC 16548]
MTPQPLTHDSVAAEIEEFLRQNAAIASDDAGFQRTTDLFDAGYLDSLTLVTLTAFLEKRFTLALTEDDLFDPRFTTIDGIAHLVTARAAC